MSYNIHIFAANKEIMDKIEILKSKLEHLKEVSKKGYVELLDELKEISSQKTDLVVRISTKRPKVLFKDYINGTDGEKGVHPYYLRDIVVKGSGARYNVSLIDALIECVTELEERQGSVKIYQAKGNKRIFITGGASGIGKALVQTFAGAGNKVTFCDIDRSKGEELAKETKAQFFFADVSRVNELENCLQSLFQQWGDIDVIINNAGISKFSPLNETSIDQFDYILSVNLRPVFITSKLLAQHRSKQIGDSKNLYGRIINICSTRYLMSEPDSESYAASKGGIFSLTHALAMSLSPLHITVNSISPGWVQNTNYEQLTETDHSQHPSGRVGRPEDIARMCLFLCEEQNDFINAENIVIDGGMIRKMVYQ